MNLKAVKQCKTASVEIKCFKFFKLENKFPFPVKGNNTLARFIPSKT